MDRVMYETIPTTPGHLLFASHIESNQPDDIQAFLQEALDNSCEGIMVRGRKKRRSRSRRRESSS